MALIRPKAIRKWTRRQLRAPLRGPKRIVRRAFNGAIAPLFYGVARNVPVFEKLGGALRLGPAAERSPGLWHGLAIGVPDDRWEDLNLALPEFSKLFAGVRTDPDDIAAEIKRRKPDALLVWGYSAGRIVRALDIDHAIRLPVVHIYDAPLAPVTGDHRAIAVDWSGLWVNSRRPCDLEDMLNQLPLSAVEAQAKIAERWVSQIQHLHPPIIHDGARPDHILIIAQDALDPVFRLSTVNQMSVGELSRKVRADFPDAVIKLVLTSPMTQTKSARRPGGVAADISLMDPATPPHQLFEGITRVCTISSPLAVYGLMAGCAVTTYGTPYYAGWGLTEDQQDQKRRHRELTLPDMLAIAGGPYSRWIDRDAKRLLAEPPQKVFG